MPACGPQCPSSSLLSSFQGAESVHFLDRLVDIFASAPMQGSPPCAMVLILCFTITSWRKCGGTKYCTPSMDPIWGLCGGFSHFLEPAQRSQKNKWDIFNCTHPVKNTVRSKVNLIPSTVCHTLDPLYLLMYFRQSTQLRTSGWHPLGFAHCGLHQTPVIMLQHRIQQL